MLKIPYGKSDYRTMIEQGYFYQDRTSYVETLENYDTTYLLYLRPRRFGKSLLISMLHYYYGLEYQKEFNRLFENTYIGKQPTKNANAYLILRFDFSAINTNTEQGVFDGFLSNVLKGIGTFLATYSEYYSSDECKEILAQKEPQEAIKSLFYHTNNREINAKIYILIDEYDHFANELISFNFDYFLDIVTKNGYVRKFYEAIKIATGQGIVERIFMTGVSPITVDSLTSGFNIATNISLTTTFHQMVGFEEKEVEAILAGIEVPTSLIPSTLDDMRLWYNGYSFSPDAQKRLYNPNMVLYFASNYKENKAYPRELLDPNIASDYTKIQKIFNIQGNAEQHLNVLKNLLETGEVTAELTNQYSFERGFSQDDLVSLLFYMGFLTIKSENLNRYTFSFPNYVIKKLYADFFLRSILGKETLQIDNRPVNDAIESMAQTGNPTAFFEQVKLVIKYFSTRDTAHFNENTLKAIIISLLHQQKFYYIHSEYETDWTDMDVFLEPVRGQKPKYEVAMELKYVAKGGKKAVNTIFEAATLQLNNYLNTPKFNTRTNIKSFVVVVAGDKLEWRLIP
jgi:Predicted AAA-ATPase/PD-(D/E)XK nuclease superfamily